MSRASEAISSSSSNRRRGGAALAAAALAGLAIGAGCTRGDPPAVTGRSPVTSPLPVVAWRDRDVAITGLPAIAASGNSIIVAQRDSDGQRGNPSLTLIERDRGDRELHRLVVITATEVDQLAPAAIAARFDAAAAWLDERNTAAHLIAMPALALRPGTDAGPAEATGDGARLRWAPSELVIELGGAGDRIARPTPASWLVEDRPLCASCTELCHVGAELGGGYLDPARRAAVVVVAYRASDTCWEPGPQAHVVAW